ncbi:MAG TPA: transglycosylase SLT domain-containing protein [Vicinamibacterales bacterium]|nr:transglycosylase SLT domain-containing protein [Vicinamibacterales bacterium]
MTRYLSLRIGIIVMVVSVLFTATPVRPSATAAAAQARAVADYWLVPAGATAAATSPLARAVADFEAGDYAKAAPVFARSVGDPVVGGYALLYLGRAQMQQKQLEAAASTVQQLLDKAPTGFLGEAALWLAADVYEVDQRWTEATKVLQQLTSMKTASPAQAHLRLGRAASHVGNTTLATAMLGKVYYEYPLSTEAIEAAASMTALNGAKFRPTEETYKFDLGRAQVLYGGRRFGDARKAFEAIRPLASGDDRSLIDLRLAQCDFHLGKHAAASDALRAIVDRGGARQAEAQFFYLGTLRELGRSDEYAALVKGYADANPTNAFAEQALNELATFYILANEDGKAADVFADLLARFPNGVYGDRAAWKAGWWAYKNGDYAKAIQFFEPAAVTFRRADYRPSWLYWAARAHDQLNERAAAIEGLRNVIADYRNSYYGRAAARELARLEAGPRPAGPAVVAAGRRDLGASIQPGTPPPNSPLIRALLTSGFYADAIYELRRAQADAGTSPMIEATIAFAQNRKGELRLGINAMRRAYPQFLADGGEQLPREILTVIFPIEHWSLIERYAAARKLDPYLVSALIAQESTFDAGIRSAANAWGLMQVVPATGRRYARSLGIPRFTTASLTNAETNIRIGTNYFADLIEQFGDVAPALAAYNAGENRVARWLSERPNIDRDEFIDDIPFPETQNYVKRILGTAEDYRVLYGRGK